MTGFMNCCGRLFLASLLGFGLVILTGCGSGANSKVGNVEGTVKINGVNANSGSIKFLGADGTPVTSAIQADGKYRAIGVGVGTAKVTVEGPPPVAKTNTPTVKDMGMGGMAPVANPILIPAKFNKDDTSGLTFPVKSGSNTYDVDLK